MQLAYRHDERLGESYEALDGKKISQKGRRASAIQYWGPRAWQSAGASPAAGQNMRHAVDEVAADVHKMLRQHIGAETPAQLIAALCVGMLCRQQICCCLAYVCPAWHIYPAVWQPKKPKQCSSSHDVELHTSKIASQAQFPRGSLGHSCRVTKQQSVSTWKAA